MGFSGLIAFVALNIYILVKLFRLMNKENNIYNSCSIYNPLLSAIPGISTSINLCNNVTSASAGKSDILN